MKRVSRMKKRRVRHVDDGDTINSFFTKYRGKMTCTRRNLSLHRSMPTVWKGCYNFYSYCGNLLTAQSLARCAH